MNQRDFSRMTKQFIEKPYEAPAYLIRFWRSGPDEPWRALAKRVADGHETAFVSPEELFTFLSAQILEESRRPVNRP